MLRWNRFGASLGFALAAAAGLPVAVTFAAPWFGAAEVARLYVLVAAAGYAWGLGDQRRSAAVVAFGGAGLLAALPLSFEATALAAAALVAFSRSAIHHRQLPLRGLAIEGLLGGLGLGAAAFLASGGLRALALAIWGYFLVQSAYFLIGGRSPRGASPTRDPFDQARSRLADLLAR